MNLWSEGSAGASDCCSCANVVVWWSRVLEEAIGYPLIVMRRFCYFGCAAGVSWRSGGE